MGKKDLLLRSISNPPLTTKGSALTLAEMDGNIVELYNALVSLSQSSNIADYDNATNYYLDDVVMYSNQLYKCIVAGPVLNVTPDTDPTKWEEIYATDLVDKPRNYKKYVANLTQIGTSAPVATVLENELSGDVVWAYNSYGNYIGTLAGAFPISKTVRIIGSPYNIGDEANAIDNANNDDVYLDCSSDGVLNNTYLEIRVYN